MTTTNARPDETSAPSETGPGPVLLVYAHPDDEVFSAAGTMAALRERGVAITLVCATRGEVGQISDPALATPETLAVVREGELRAAMAALDVADVRFFDYRDSGMEGTPENDDPRALLQQPEAVVAARIAAVIRDERPSVVLTFGPDGIYGHPDHLFIHRATVQAINLVAEPPHRPTALYFSTTSRERIQERAAHRQGPFKEMSPERLALLGTPRAEITTVLDVSAYADRKRAALRSHRTQFGPNGPMSELPPDEVALILSREHFVRARLPWDDPAAEALDPIAALNAELGTTPL
jgi:LmbE family N-acetylglucosaminyl deacetylase